MQEQMWKGLKVVSDLNHLEWTMIVRFGTTS